MLDPSNLQRDKREKKWDERDDIGAKKKQRVRNNIETKVKYYRWNNVNNIHVNNVNNVNIIDWS